MLRAEEVPVVAGALFGRAEGCVCFAYLYEALRCAAVVWVEVGVVRFGEFVELSVRLLGGDCVGIGGLRGDGLLYFSWGGVGGYVECFVVVWHAMVIVAAEGWVESPHQ